LNGAQESPGRRKAAVLGVGCIGFSPNPPWIVKDLRAMVPKISLKREPLYVFSEEVEKSSCRVLKGKGEGQLQISSVSP
jgi:hypothetical protein